MGCVEAMTLGIYPPAVQLFHAAVQSGRGTTCVENTPYHKVSRNLFVTVELR